MTKEKRRFIILLVIFLLSIIGFLTIWLVTYANIIKGNLDDPNIKIAIINIFKRRSIQMIALIVSAVLISTSSLSFQTITQSRILTPSILGFDAIFIITQTVLIFLFGSMSIFTQSKYLNFFLTTGIMMVIIFLMFVFILRKNSNNIILLLLLGLVVTSLASSMTHFLQVFMHPEDFQNVIDITNVNVNAINESLVFISIPLLIIIFFLIYKDHKVYDVMALGESSAVNLGVNYNQKINLTLVYITISIALATALVGPLSFLGLIAVNGAKEMFKTNKHKKLIILSSLISVTFLLFGQVILELIKLKTPVTVIINLIGGIYLLYILVKENKND